MEKIHDPNIFVPMLNIISPKQHFSISSNLLVLLKRASFEDGQLYNPREVDLDVSSRHVLGI